MGLLDFITSSLPFIVMVIVETLEVGMITLGKSAMNGGMSNLVFVVYYNALGTLLLLPYFIFHTYRSNLPPLTFSILCRFFILGLIGICFLQVFAYAGIDYSSPTLASAIGNLIPAFTFIFAVIFRMESLHMRKVSTQAKVLGTIVAIAGAFVMTLYKGQVIHIPTSASNLPQTNLLSLSSRQSNWVLGGICIAVASICSSLWNILQAATIKDYPDRTSVVFFFCCFGSIQAAIFTLIVDRSPGAWTLRPDIATIAIIYAAVFGCVFRNIVFTWCLQKKGPVYVSLFKPLGMVIAVIMGFLFLGDELHLGSIIGGTIIAAGFYTVMWGKAKEKYTVTDPVTGLQSPTESDPLLPK